ncbi:hypothetical protein B0H21DRAFT_12919 [Amylocystis lapponica]|nr:hypothetical protein B0H21DRAFT_12919 [Amylocystis lapponica]
MPGTNKAHTASRPAVRTSVTFKSFETSEDVPDEMQNEDEDNGSGGLDEENNMVEMLKMLDEYKKRKASTRSVAFQSKKNALFDEARKNASAVVRDGVAQIEQCKTTVAELRSQEISQDKRLNTLLVLWKNQDDIIRTVIAAYPPLIEDLSHRRADQINEASAMLEAHCVERQDSRRRLIKNAKARMDENLESQKLATDANALIKHYKALLLA